MRSSSASTEIANDPMCNHRSPDALGGYEKKVAEAKTADAMVELGEGSGGAAEEVPQGASGQAPESVHGPARTIDAADASKTSRR